MLAMAGCGPGSAGIDPEAHRAEVMEWRAGRLERLLQPNGYLTQVGLQWVEEGSYSMGSADDSDIVLPPVAARGVAWLEYSARAAVHTTGQIPTSVPANEPRREGIPEFAVVLPCPDV